MSPRRRCAAALAAAIALGAATSAQAQTTCPTPIADALRLVVVTAPVINQPAAAMRLYERAAVNEPWRAVGAEEPVTIGRFGMAWSPFFRRLALEGEPIKTEGDKRTPAGIYPIGRSFGTVRSPRADHIAVTGDTVCVDDPTSPAYNTITSRKQIGATVHHEAMSKMPPMYRRGLVVNYPTDAKAKAGSCIFIHVWRSPTTGTAGCVAMPEERVAALQEFTDGKPAAIAILPRGVVGRLGACLPRL